MDDDDFSNDPLDAIGVKPSDSDYKPQDWLLLNLVHIVEVADGGVTIPITLHVGGMQITGQLASGRVYFKEFVAQIRSATGTAGAEIVETIADGIERLGTAIYGRIGDAQKDGRAAEDEVLNRRFVHLIDARVSSPGSPPPGGAAMIWRGKLSAVDGFAFGQHTPVRT